MIDLAELKAKHDVSVKELLADKQIIARILKYTLDDFSNDEIKDIIEHMGNPEVFVRRLEPGFTNTEKVQKLSEEDKVKGEGAIYYDIRTFVYKGGWIKVLINIEAQQITSPSGLGYHLDNRILFYLGRMISAQKEVEFRNSDYDGLKAVRSIWICMDSADDEDSITRYRFLPEHLYGKELKLENMDKVQAVIIRLRKNDNAAVSKNSLVAMLEELLRKESAEEKKRKLETDYGIVMSVEIERRIHIMCGISEAILEQGIEQGIEQGRIRILADLINDKVINLSEAARRMDMTVEEFRQRLEKSGE